MNEVFEGVPDTHTWPTSTYQIYTLTNYIFVYLKSILSNQLVFGYSLNFYKDICSVHIYYEYT